MTLRDESDSRPKRLLAWLADLASAAFVFVALIAMARGRRRGTARSR